jgi:ubiquinone/menaquinone biosynthesis C-methylase UbiE
MDYDHACLNYDFSRTAGKSNVQLLVELLYPLKNSLLLDVGCGTGNHVLKLRDLARHVVGLDPSAGMLSQAKAKAWDASLLRADAQFMPFSNRAFNAAYCIQALHHVPDKGKFISELYRILKPGGRFAVESCSHEQLATFCCYHYFPRALEIDRQRIPDIGEVAELLSAAGFCDITIHVCPLEDGFRDAPADYLDKRVRDGSSTFALLTAVEIEEGCERIRQDMRSGKAAGIEADYRLKAGRMAGRVSFVRAVKP